MAAPRVVSDHHGPWTVADVLALPHDDKSYELVDGALIVNPPPSPYHQAASGELFVLLRAACGPGLRALEAVGVQLGQQLLIPDLVVVRASAASLHAPVLDPADVVLVVEIVSPGSRVRDRSEKPVIFAEAGIPHFWRVETSHYQGRSAELPAVLIHELDDNGAYVLARTLGAGEVATVTEPFEVAFDPAELLRPLSG
ncbi:Uma2 family endonuclease [Labedaea rhizosphaerae]|uniref:Uma2 family endonuclease n=2 Tax=Labedaea rhizosphaerae TaxID=598644 RepID=A0A4R6RXV4_LABRH|nr:Uma2 family endonuclease [Labedaea rhizosphaerae]